MMVRRSLPVLAAALVFAFAGVSHAQITEPEALCRAKLSKSMAKLIKTAQKSIVNCHRLRDAAAIADTVQCNYLVVADSATGSRTAKALLQLETTVERYCEGAPTVLSQYPRCPAPAAEFDDAGTAGIDGYDELTTCFFAHVERSLYAMNSDALGHPDTGLGEEKLDCRAAIAKGISKLLATTIKVRSKCQADLDAGGGPLSFECATADPGFKILGTLAKAEEKVAAECASLNAEGIDACASFASGILDCAIEKSLTTAGGLASMIWELPGTCPGAVVLSADHDLDHTDADTGWTGLGHDSEATSGFYVVNTALDCDEDCANCVDLEPTPVAANCRCSGDAIEQCDTNVDCAGVGGTCQCFLSPPVAVSTGLPLCITDIAESPLEATLDPATRDASISGTTRRHVHTGISQTRPCPECVGNQCVGGARHGLACTPGSFDPTFGVTSLDCPPSAASDITGPEGIGFAMDLSTGGASLPFAIPCDPPNQAESCACSTCSLDNTIACNSDADCSAEGAGVCRTDGAHGGAARQPNDCVNGVCSVDPAGPSTEGVCLGDADETYCDGLLRADGSGLISCADDGDCVANGASCPANDCGSCSHGEKRRCFLDPIEATGVPGHLLVGTGCVAPSASMFVNGPLGLPGPSRTQRSVTMSVFCADEATVFEGPGGSNCP